MGSDEDEVVRRVMDALSSRPVSERTTRTYEQVLGRYFAWCDEQRIHPLLADDVALDGFTLELQKTISQRTAAAYQSVLNVFYEEALHQGVIHKSPMRGFRRAAPKHTFAPVSLVPMNACER